MTPQWGGAMTAAQSREYAETLTIPAMLPLMGLNGRIEAVETRNEQIARTLDIVGGIDFWIRTSDGRLVAIASRNQWWKDDGVNRYSFTIRVDIGGSKTEAHKRVLAIKDGGLVPDWTLQGYITAAGDLHHAGAIPTRDLFAAFLEAAHNPRFTTRCNPADGHEFWPGYWETLRRYGHGGRLKTLSEQMVLHG
jgi:hypothetical protein